MSAELKYTDRDVRDDEKKMRRLVEDYLDEYTGEFTYLVDCKMRLAMGGDLTIGMIRGSLNCMRHDPRVTNLPPPKVFDTAEVVPIKRNRKTKQPPEQPNPEPTRYTHQCYNQQTFHGPHNWSEKRRPSSWDGSPRAYYRCPGNHIKTVITPAKLKTPYFASRTGGVAHAIANVRCVWESTKDASLSAGVYTTSRLIVRPTCAPKGAGFEDIHPISELAMFLGVPSFALKAVERQANDAPVLTFCKACDKKGGFE